MTVPTLLQWSGPATIRRVVGAVIVYAIKRHAFWAWPHVLTKREEVVPSRADLYAAPAITVKPSVLWVFAAIHHLQIRAVQRVLGVAVCKISEGGSFGSVTAARHGSAVSEVCSVDFAKGAAVTAAKPYGCAGSVPDKADDSPSTEFLIHEINTSGHASLLHRFVGQVTGWHLRAAPLRY